MGEGFTWDSADLTIDQAIAADAWAHARSLIQAGDHQLVVLDEITYPINWEWIDIADVVATITGRPSHVSVICTGRNAPAELDRHRRHGHRDGRHASTPTSRASGPRRASTIDRPGRRPTNAATRLGSPPGWWCTYDASSVGEANPARRDPKRRDQLEGVARLVERRVVELVTAERRAGGAERARRPSVRGVAVAERQSLAHRRGHRQHTGHRARRRASGPATAGRRTRPT